MYDRHNCKLRLHVRFFFFFTLTAPPFLLSCDMKWLHKIDVMDDVMICWWWIETLEGFIGTSFKMVPSALIQSSQVYSIYISWPRVNILKDLGLRLHHESLHNIILIPSLFVSQIICFFFLSKFFLFKKRTKPDYIFCFLFLILWVGIDPMIDGIKVSWKTKKTRPPRRIE